MTKEVDKRLIAPEAIEKLRETVLALFADNHFHEVGIRDICKQAGVSQKTIYKYFGNKEQLLLACIEQDLQTLSDSARIRVDAAKTLMEALSELVYVQFEFYAEHPTIAHIVFQNLPSSYWILRQSKAQAEFQALTYKLFAEWLSHVNMAKQYDTHFLVDFFTGAAHRLILRWVLDNEMTDLVKVGRNFVSFTLEQMLEREMS